MNKERSSISYNQPDIEGQFKPYVDPLVDIVVPVLNEEAVLDFSIRRLDDFMKNNLSYRYRIVIADNGSTDGTKEIAEKLVRQFNTVHIKTFKQRGRGRALKQVWIDSPADILTYMDVDLSTSLEGFLPMIKPLIKGTAGVGFGSRLSKESKTTRCFKREFISRCYNRIIRLVSKTKFLDAQCGFKAIRKDVAEKFLLQIKDNGWFFDTELLIKTERAGIILHEQPVTWLENTDSRVDITRTAIDDLKGLYRVRKELDTRSLFEKLSLPVLLVATGALYLFGALHNGMANSYYSAAVQASSQSWTSWLYGSLDAANYISVDKPPIATMIMGLSARIFGFSSFSMLLPNVLAGVGTAALLFASVKRTFGSRSAMIAGSVFLFTPVAALMFGFNNPDAILTFFLMASAYAFLRALEQKKTLFWLVIAVIMTGFAFNTKMLQGLMVLPAMAIVYILFTKNSAIKKAIHLFVAMIVAAISTFWWSILVWLTPASNRPWVGSTTDNNIWTLIFGYNGFGRLLGTGSGQGGIGPSVGAAIGGQGGGMVGGVAGGQGPGGSGFGGSTGVLRILNGDFGPNIGWLLLAAIIGGGVMLWILRKSSRHSRGRAAVLFWLLWLVTHIVIFSMTSGVIHPYYVVVMAPAVAALIGISLPFIWSAYKNRNSYAYILPAMVAVTTIVSSVIIGYSSVVGWLAWILLAAGVAGIVCLVSNIFNPRKLFVITGIVGSLIACLLGPIVYTITTVNVSHTGSIPTSGPSSTAMAGSNNENAIADSSLVNYLIANQDGAVWIVAVASANESAAIQLTSNQPVMAVGGFNGSDTALTLTQFKNLISQGKIKYYAVSNSGDSKVGSGNSSISSWVTKYCTKVDYGGSNMTLYKLSV